MNRLDESSTGSPMVEGPRNEDSPASAPAGMGMGSVPSGSGPGPKGGGPTALDWDLLDRRVQDALAPLTARILAQEPGAIWKAGRTATRAFPLFSHRVFYHLDGDDYDPVVVGLTFTALGSIVRVAGDISGDESGFVYYDEGCTIEVPAEPLAVIDAARVVADRLASRDSVVLDAIRSRHPRAVAR